MKTKNVKRAKSKRRFQPNNYSVFMETVVKWLELRLVNSGALHLGLSVIQKYLKVLNSRGKADAIRYCKDARASILRWLAASDISNNKVEPPKRYGVPRVLRFLGGIKGPEGYPLIRLVLSALYASRDLTLPAVPNVAAITSPPKSEFPPDISRYVDEFWDVLGYPISDRVKVPSSVYWKRFHLSTKAGPNGQAMWSALADLYSLPESLFEAICKLGGKRLRVRMELLRDLGVNNFLHRFFTGTRFGRYRKVVAIPSQEGKTREIAILDYWSQTALKGLHRYLFGVLRRIPQDCTFNQGSFVEKLPFDEGNAERYHSIDLTAATDRFPIELICRVLSGRFGDEYVNNWRTIMVGFPFWTKEFGDITYSVGNPMGAYSSWNSFALSHHYLMFWCCRELGLNWKKAQYVILGDDVVIRNDALAAKYMEALTRLGVEYSPAKTHSSPFMYEFAKRVVHSGIELTPFPIAALYSTRKQKSLQLNVCDSEQRKGWCFPNGIPAELSELFSFLRYPRRYVQRTKKSMFITYQFLKAMRGEESAKDALQQISDSYYPTVNVDNDTLAIRLCRTAVLTVLESSFSSLTKKSGKALGQVAENLVIMITGAVFEETPRLLSDGRENSAIDVSTLIQSLPVLNVYGQIEELYLKMRRTCSNPTYLLSGDWKTTLRSLQLPESDQVFYTRNQDLQIQSSFSLAKIITKLFEMGQSDPDRFRCVTVLGPIWTSQSLPWRKRKRPTK